MIALSLFILLSISGPDPSDPAIFAVTPEQMVFASKLSDRERKIFCHQFSKEQKMQALQAFGSGSLCQSADDIVRMIATGAL